MLPTREAALALLHDHVKDAYQRTHAVMVATALEGYAVHLHEPVNLWFVAGLLHDLDFEEHPAAHPGPSLEWFKGWGYPPELIHAVEAHAYGYNAFQTLPQTRLAAALLATDELCGLFYAYRKLKPVAYAAMKPASIKKKFREPSFAAKIDRRAIELGVQHLRIDLDTHIANVAAFLAPLD